MRPLDLLYMEVGILKEGLGQQQAAGSPGGGPPGKPGGDGWPDKPKTPAKPNPYINPHPPAEGPDSPSHTHTQPDKPFIRESYVSLRGK